MLCVMLKSIFSVAAQRWHAILSSLLSFHLFVLSKLCYIIVWVLLLLHYIIIRLIIHMVTRIYSRFYSDNYLLFNVY